MKSVRVGRRTASHITEVFAERGMIIE